MKIKCIVILVVFAISLQSCEWTKKKLGLLTKHEIAEMEKILEEKERQKKILNSAVDTNANIKAECVEKKDSVSNNSIELKQEKKVEKVLEEKYYIVLGSFRNSHNANKLIDSVEKLGYDVRKISLLRGLETVAVGVYNTNEEALEILAKMKNEPFYSSDFWIYKKKKKI